VQSTTKNKGRPRGDSCFALRRGRVATLRVFPTSTLSALFLLVGEKGSGMGYQDAIRDGVRVELVGNRGETYYIPCCLCGADVKSFSYHVKQKYICKECVELDRLIKRRERAEIRAKERAEKGIGQPIQKTQEQIEKIREKNEAMLTRATKRIDKMSTLAKFSQAIGKVKAEMDDGVVFGSTEEVLVALELSRQGVKYRAQVKFGPYRADFVLDDYKVVLEVDGKLFHSEERKFQEQFRDGLILAGLGPKWELVRVTDENINKHITRLMCAIATVVEGRKSRRVRDAEFIRRSKQG